jgi:hypothetical protein
MSSASFLEYSALLDDVANSWTLKRTTTRLVKLCPIMSWNILSFALIALLGVYVRQSVVVMLKQQYLKLYRSFTIQNPYPYIFNDYKQWSLSLIDSDSNTYEQVKNNNFSEILWSRNGSSEETVVQILEPCKTKFKSVCRHITQPSVVVNLLYQKVKDKYHSVSTCTWIASQYFII